jgi:hypothetical protein
MRPTRISIYASIGALVLPLAACSPEQVVILHFAQKRIGQERMGYPYAARAGLKESEMCGLRGIYRGGT